YNDQGLIEFVQAAFVMFGVDIKSMYYFYFTVLAASMLVFAAAFRKTYAAGVVLFGCAFAVFAFMPSALITNPELISVSNPRFLSTLGIVPLLHILLMFAQTRTSQMSWPALLGVIFQAALVS